LSEGDSIVGLGSRGDLVAQVPNQDPARLRLTPEEQAVYAAVGRAATIADVIGRSGHSEPKTIALLLSLRAKGAIAPARVPRAASAAMLDAALLEDVELEHGLKREILDMEQALENQNHFELLGLEPAASDDEIRAAYHRASKKFHPDRYFQKRLGSFHARLERIFKRLSEANAVLSDPDARAAYLKAHPGLDSSPRLSPEDPSRVAERRARLARHPLLERQRKGHELLAAARADLASGELARAFAALNDAAQLEPRNRAIQELLQQANKKQAAVRAKTELANAEQAELGGDAGAAVAAYRRAFNLDPTNARAAARCAAVMLRFGWDLKEAKSLAERAAQLEPKSASYRALLGAVLFEAGAKKLARKAFEEALELDPSNAEAKARLRKLRWTF